MDNKILKWPIEFTHEFHHKRMCDNLFECLTEFATSTLEEQGMPRLVDGSPDYGKISVSHLFMWFAKNANKPDHEEKKDGPGEDRV